MMAKIGRGLTRIWMVFIVLIELAMGVGFAFIASHERDPPFAGLVIMMVLLALGGYIIWLVAKWVARGFSD